MTTFTFTARNSAHLDKQIEQANEVLKAAGGEALTVVVGRACSGHKLWYVHGAYGHNLKDGLQFDAVVREVEQRFCSAFEANYWRE